MECAFVDLRSGVRCAVVCDDNWAFCKRHSHTLQARYREASIMNVDGTDYIVRDGMVCAYMDALKNRPLTRSQVILLRKENLDVHPYVVERLDA